MKISVVIPTYNRAEMLRRTVQSVLEQRRVPDEIVIVDDGSTDHTRAVAASFGNSIVRYVHQENAHLSAARNTGQRVATGDALLFLDSDDLLLPGALGALEKALEAAPQAALAYCLLRFIDLDDNPLPTVRDNEQVEGDVWEAATRGNFVGSPGCALMRRSHLEAAGPWDTSLRACEDWDMYLRLSERAPFARVDEVLFLYRRHGENMSGDMRLLERMMEKVCRNYLAHIRRVDPARQPVVARAYARLRRRHRLRWLLEGTGIARLYRQTPLALRLKVRGLLRAG